MVKIALLQFNPTVGAVSNNCQRILDFAQQAYQQGAHLLITPELSLVGYPPQDLLLRAELHQQVIIALKLLTQAPIPILVGAPIAHHLVGRAPLWNAMVACQPNGWQVVARKRLLPNYDVFDERRYFAPGDAHDGSNIWEFLGHRLGIVICEDVWNDPSDTNTPLYAENPVADVVNEGADVLINPASSPFTLRKPQKREAILRHLAQKYQKPLLMAGQAGGNDQLLFDGSSCVIDATGQVLTKAPVFEETLVFHTLSKQTQNPLQLTNRPEAMALLEKALCTGIRDYFRKCGFQKAVLGLSGGIDSAVVATLAARALGPHNVMGLLMPSQFSSAHSIEDAKTLANALGIQYITIPIEPSVETLRQTTKRAFEATWPDTSGIADQNLQARVRGILLMDYSNRNNALLLATGNKSELAVGYTTLYGDMTGAIAPIGDIYKTQVWQLAKHLNCSAHVIPNNTLQKPPSAELKPGQQDQDNLPTYKVLDVILQGYIDEELSADQISAQAGVDKSLIYQIIQMVHRSEYKRNQSPLCLMVSEKVFKAGRRWPIAQAFQA